MTTPFPDFTLYLKVGIEGIESEEVKETLSFAYDEDLTDEQNAQVFMANAQLSQVRLQVQFARLLKRHLGIDTSLGE